MPLGERWARHLLNKLVDGYERRGGNLTRRLSVPVSDRTLPEYLHGGDPDAVRECHGILARWQEEGIVRLEWVKHEEGNLLRRVILCPEGVERAYRLLGRVPERERWAALEEEIRRRREEFHLPWVRAWLDLSLAQLRERGSVPDSLIPADGETRQGLWRALRGIEDKGEEELTERVFSMRYLGGSKVFERRVRGRLVGLLRRFGPSPRGEAEEEEEALLGEVGILRNQEDIAFFGPLRARIRDRIIDAGAFPYGLALDADTLREAEIVDLPVRTVLSIENKAVFRLFVRQVPRDVLVLYLGGFPSPGKRRFLRQIRDVLGARAVYRHWGDLDYGGILIAQNIREAVWPEVKPWRMEPEWLDRYRDLAEPFGEAYRRRLERLREEERYREFWPLVDKLLEVGGTLEQEALVAVPRGEVAAGCGAD
ncbi:MAG: DUF2220 family protein [Alicyclobacillaceae bacterium]|nr:DUF2220 family protein [Alicyclobacillaceae bacterium]